MAEGRRDSPWDVLRSAWAAEVLLALREEPRHFNAIGRRLGDVPASTLSARLDALVEEGFVRRTEMGERPERVRYELTDRGRELAGAVGRLDRLGDDERR